MLHSLSFAPAMAPSLLEVAPLRRLAMAPTSVLPALLALSCIAAGFVPAQDRRRPLALAAKTVADIVPPPEMPVRRPSLDASALAVLPSIFAPFRTPGTGCSNTRGSGRQHSKTFSRSFPDRTPGSNSAAPAPHTFSSV